MFDRRRIGAVIEHALSLQRQKPLHSKGFCGGAEGIRTLDPLTASQVLCQAELQPQLVEPVTHTGFTPIIPIDVD